MSNPDVYYNSKGEKVTKEQYLQEGGVDLDVLSTSNSDVYYNSKGEQVTKEQYLQDGGVDLDVSSTSNPEAADTPTYIRSGVSVDPDPNRVPFEESFLRGAADWAAYGMDDAIAGFGSKDKKAAEKYRQRSKLAEQEDPLTYFAGQAGAGIAESYISPHTMVAKLVARGVNKKAAQKLAAYLAKTKNQKGMARVKAEIPGNVARGTAYSYGKDERDLSEDPIGVASDAALTGATSAGLGAAFNTVGVGGKKLYDKTKDLYQGPILDKAKHEAVRAFVQNKQADSNLIKNPDKRLGGDAARQDKTWQRTGQDMLESLVNLRKGRGKPEKVSDAYLRKGDPGYNEALKQTRSVLPNKSYEPLVSPWDSALKQNEKLDTVARALGASYDEVFDMAKKNVGTNFGKGGARVDYVYIANALRERAKNLPKVQEQGTAANNLLKLADDLDPVTPVNLKLNKIAANGFETEADKLKFWKKANQEIREAAAKREALYKNEKKLFDQIYPQIKYDPENMTPGHVQALMNTRFSYKPPREPQDPAANSAKIIENNVGREISDELIKGALKQDDAVIEKLGMTLSEYYTQTQKRWRQIKGLKQAAQTKMDKKYALSDLGLLGTITSAGFFGTGNITAAEATGRDNWDVVTVGSGLLSAYLGAVAFKTAQLRGQAAQARALWSLKNKVEKDPGWLQRYGKQIFDKLVVKPNQKIRPSSVRSVIAAHEINMKSNADYRKDFETYPEESNNEVDEVDEVDDWQLDVLRELNK